MKNLLATITMILCATTTVSAQAVWNRGHLDAVKNSLDRPMYAIAYDALTADADSLLGVEPLSVTMKQKAAPSGDCHDYVSLARYFHPDPSKPDGRPYINRDGITNPEIDQWDRNRLGETADRIATLALAWYLSDDRRYAVKAAELLRTWFLDDATRMNPNFEYAQMVPGVNGDKGRCYGVLDGYSFVEMLDGVALLEGSNAWTATDDRRLKEWFARMLDWMLTSDQGIEESNQANNHSTAYDAQVTAIAMYVGRDDIARRIISEVPGRRIFTQIEPDGSQPHEMWRTLSYGYSQYNLTHLIDIFIMAGKLGMSIDKSTDAEGRSFYKALDLLASYLGRPAGDWPGQQISGWEDKQQAVARDLWRTGTAVDSTRADYRQAYQLYRIFDPADRFTLLYYTPDDVDDAFVLAGRSLQYAIRRVRTERRKESNRTGMKVSPRSIDADGVMTLVHPHDWTSGFFPGELWMMYEFTNDPRWRAEADAFSRDIEMCKTHGGTHDLGFMIGDSFGKGWELTGDSCYLDVTRTAAETLATRYNHRVGAIRSWDHNAEVWRYPVIIDNMMNLEMLFKVSELTGDKRFHDIAVSHADATMRNHFRPDKSSYHVVDYDPSDGSVRMRVTAQGYADDSYWSRGQGWAIYGYTMCYRHTGDRRYLDHAREVADWWLSLPNMPADLVPYWDMKAPGTDVNDNAAVPRDASAAALIASALYELATYADPDDAARYRSRADATIASLTKNYTLAPDAKEGFILDHSTGHLPAGGEIDVPIIYADYYYLEALLRKRAVNKL
ncbi:MAG: alginate lyase family protein [Bacteroidales bacterium]|nr:alginate lyase family protein [Bacteroidales bacterium]